MTSSNVGSARYRPPNKLDLDHWLRVAEDRAHVTITCYMTIKRVSYVRPRIEYVSVLGCCDLLTSREDTLRYTTYSFGTITDIDGDSMQPRGDGIVTISIGKWFDVYVYTGISSDTNVNSVPVRSKIYRLLTLAVTATLPP